MNQVEEFLGQSQVEHPEEHPEEQSKPNEAKKKKLDRGRDRLMNLQECRDQYDECVSAPVGLGQQNSTDFGINPPNVILESTHRHCSKNRRRCIDRVREREEKTEDRRQRTENIRNSRTEDRGREHSHPHLPSLGNGDRLKGLQECQVQYEDCVSDTHHMPAGGLGQQNSSVTTNEPPDTRLHCAKKHRRCIDRVREREEKTVDRRQRTEDVNIRTSRTEERQPFLQPPLRIAPVDGVHATSFALGALVAFTLSAVAYFVRRPRGTKMTDSRGAYGAATV